MFSVFSTYLLVVLLKFRAGALVGYIIQFRIQRVSTLHTFDAPTPQKIINTLKKRVERNFECSCSKFE